MFDPSVVIGQGPTMATTEKICANLCILWQKNVKLGVFDPNTPGSLPHNSMA
jgi:hypothetical protein